MSIYWHPRFKWQLVDWLVRQGVMKMSKAQRMTKKQLYGKYKEVRSG